MRAGRQPNRLPRGGSIDRSRPLSFTFDGRSMQGFEGDTAASALLAAGVRIVGRSFKTHRPRGIFAAGLDEPNALLSVEDGFSFEPMMRATQILLREGMRLGTLNSWPSAERDLAAIAGVAASLLVSGFYYKTFLWPSWRIYEGLIRRAAGIGRLRPAKDCTHYEHVHETTDVLVIGGGPAGVAAASALVDSNLKVLLVDDQPHLGGSLKWGTATVDGRSAVDWAAASERGLREAENVRLLTSATVCGAYENNLFVIAEQEWPGTGKASDPPVQRIRKVRANQVILATGAIERTIVFQNNDRPGVMLAAAVRRYVNQYAVAPGRRIVFFTNNDSAYSAALDVLDRGLEVVAFVDTRAAAHVGQDAAALAGRGVAPRYGSQVIDVTGRRGVKSVTISDHAGTSRKTFECDLLAVSGGWTPLVHLASHRGPRPVYYQDHSAFAMDSLPHSWHQAGGVALAATMEAAMAQGVKAAEIVAARLGGATASTFRIPAVEDRAYGKTVPFWRASFGAARKMWVDYQSDVTVRDVSIAAMENYASVEHLKRYTTIGMATDQGRTSNTNALAILAEETSREIAELGVTTYRPPFIGLKMNAIAGVQRGELYAVKRRTPLDGEHLTLAAEMADFGSWLRPDHYRIAGGDREAAIAAEMAAVRSAVGLFDASPLGKIEIAGADAAVFANHFYVSNMLTLKQGQVRYSLILRDDGVVFDDGVLARLSENHFLASTTTAHADQVAALFERWRQTEWPGLRVAVAPMTSAWATIAIAGPAARSLLQRMEPSVRIDPPDFRHMSIREGRILGVPCRIARVSFTGELQFEVSVPARFGADLWRRALAVGRDLGVQPVGMEAWLRLRLEKGFVHLGADTDGRTTPADLGFGDVVARKAADFLGKRSLSLPFMSGPDREQLVGLRAMSGASLEVGGRIFAPGHERPPAPTDGHVTSACFSPSAGQSIGLALLKNGRTRVGETVKIEQRGRRVAAEVTSPVFYDPSGARMRS